MEASDCFSQFWVTFKNEKMAEIKWSLIGKHNMQNGLAAIAAAFHVGVKPAVAIEALNRFQGVKRRLELKANTKGIQIFDDFAHHPQPFKPLWQAFGQKSVMSKEFLPFLSYALIPCV